jgi:hypothetical protein
MPKIQFFALIMVNIPMQARNVMAYTGKQIKFMFLFAYAFWKRRLSQAPPFVLFRPATFFC